MYFFLSSIQLFFRYVGICFFRFVLRPLVLSFLLVYVLRLFFLLSALYLFLPFFL